MVNRLAWRKTIRLRVAPLGSRPCGRSSPGSRLGSWSGGKSATTTAVNLAASLAAAEKRVLLVDIDPQGNASSGVGHVRGEEAGTSVYDLLVGAVTLDQAIRKTELPHLDLVPADADLAGAEIELVPVADRERQLRRSIRAAADRYDYVLIDTPPSLGL